MHGKNSREFVRVQSCGSSGSKQYSTELLAAERSAAGLLLPLRRAVTAIVIIMRSFVGP